MKYLVTLTLNDPLYDGQTIELTDFGAIVSEDDVISGEIRGDSGGVLGHWEIAASESPHRYATPDFPMTRMQRPGH